MWHKVRVTYRGGSKKARYMTTFREGVESVAVFKDVHGGPLKVRNHSLEVKEEPFRGHGSKLKVVKGTVYLHTGVVAAKEDTDMQLATQWTQVIQSPESYDNIDSWDAANCWPDVKKYDMQRKA
eukprot:jgi/Tetstr1/448677/TSEL_035917.t1